MLLHRVDGVRIEHADVEDFSVHTVTFSSEGSSFARVTFYTDLGDRLLVNGEDVWGVVGKGSPNVQHDVHLRDGRDGRLRVKRLLSGTGNWIHQFYVGTDCRLSVASRGKLDFEVRKAEAVLAEAGEAR